MIHIRLVRFPFHTGWSRAKIQLAIASDSPGEFPRLPALNDNPVLNSLCLLPAGELAWVSFVRWCNIQDQNTGLPSWRSKCFQLFAVLCIKLIINVWRLFYFFVNLTTSSHFILAWINNAEKQTEATRLHVLYNACWLWVKNTKFSFYSLCIFSAVVIKNNVMYHLSIIAGSLAGTGQG